MSPSCHSHNPTFDVQQHHHKIHISDLSEPIWRHPNPRPCLWCVATAHNSSLFQGNHTNIPKTMSPPSSSMDLSDQSKEGSRRLRQYPSLLQKDPDVMSASLGTMSPLLSDRTFSRSLSVGHVPTSVLSPFGGPLSPLGGPKSLRASLPSELPFAPSLNNSPKPVSVMEQAMQRERKRRLEKEAGEKELGVDQLRAILRDERNRMSRMAADLAALQSAAVASHVQAEVHEEGRINSLMRRLKSLQHQKGRIMVELEKEEEMVKQETVLSVVFEYELTYCTTYHRCTIHSPGNSTMCERKSPCCKSKSSRKSRRIQLFRQG